MSVATRAATVVKRHRGPFSFCVTRAMTTKPGFYQSEWLKGSVEAEDLMAEAAALFDDPRDTIKSIAVWSDRDHRFVTVLNLKWHLLKRHPHPTETDGGQ